MNIHWVQAKRHWVQAKRVVLTLIFAAVAGVWAQDQVPTFTIDTREVDLNVSVTDKNGNQVPGIPQSAFKVFENNVEQPIKAFTHLDVPVSMGIVIDNSGSMRDKKASVNAASMALVRASNPQDEVFIIGFNDQPYLDQEFTSDVKLLEKALDKTETRGGTLMRDSIHLALDHMKKLAKHDKRVLLVITDGNDNISDETPEQLVREARQSEVLIYSIGLLNEEDPKDKRDAQHALKALAEASGGLDYYPKTLAEVERVTPQIAYTPLNSALDGTYRKIEVKLTGFGKPNVRYRNGYFATSDAQGSGAASRSTPSASKAASKSK
jgi:Ca-activated chloride channel family protein